MRRLLTVVFCLAAIQGFGAPVKVGFSVVDVTPELSDLGKGIRTDGWRGPLTIALKADGQLSVRAAAMRDENNTLLTIVTVDSAKLYPVDVMDIEQWFEKKFHSSRWNLVMNVSHTHQAPRWFPLDKDPYAKTYHKLLTDAIRRAIAEAVARAVTPMTVKYAKLKIGEDMIFNKNAYCGFTDLETDLPVFAFFDAKTRKITGFLCSMSAHFTWAVLAPEGRIRLSAHVPGAVFRALKESFGGNVVAMLAQGAAGELKVQFPEFKNVKAVRNRKLNNRPEQRRNNGKGEAVTYEEYLVALDSYGRRIAAIIKKGLDDGSFREVQDINLKITGREAVILGLESEKIPERTKLRIRTWKRYYAKDCGKLQSVEFYQQQLAQAPDEPSRYHARTMLWLMNDRGERVYRIPFRRIMLNRELQIVTMGAQTCSGIGKQIKDFYAKQGMATVFLAFSPFGVYYPTNKLHAAGVYQAAWLFPADADFNFDKFALDNVTALKPELQKVNSVEK